MKFLKNLIKFLSTTSTTDENTFSKVLEETEPLGRFVVDPKHIYAETGKVKPAAFYPRQVERDLSVYRLKQLLLDAIWGIADKYVTNNRRDSKKAIALGEITLARVKQLQLRANPDGIPHHRHLNIEDWPVERHKQQQLALEMAKEAITKKRQ